LCQPSPNSPSSPPCDPSPGSRPSAPGGPPSGLLWFGMPVNPLRGVCCVPHGPAPLPSPGVSLCVGWGGFDAPPLYFFCQKSYRPFPPRPHPLALPRPRCPGRGASPVPAGCGKAAWGHGFFAGVRPRSPDLPTTMARGGGAVWRGTAPPPPAPPAAAAGHVQSNVEVVGGFCLQVSGAPSVGRGGGRVWSARRSGCSSGTVRLTCAHRDPPRLLWDRCSHPSSPVACPTPDAPLGCDFAS